MYYHSPVTDDLLLTEKNTEEIAKIKSDVHKESEMTNLGQAHTYLVTKIEQSSQRIILRQTSYIKKF